VATDLFQLPYSLFAGGLLSQGNGGAYAQDRDKEDREEANSAHRIPPTASTTGCEKAQKTSLRG
jgi:hypothetical protein